MSTAVVTVPFLADMLKRATPQIQAALPPNLSLTPDRLIRVALSEFTKNPKFRECSAMSFCSAVVQAAQMGLEFGEMKHCALVPYGGEIKLMVQYQGWLAMLWRSRSVKNVQAKAVFDGDTFNVEYGSETRVTHIPMFKSIKPVLYYAAAVPTEGELMVEVMSYEQVVDHMKQYAKGYDRKDSAWNSSFDAMALKTVLRKLIKLLPLTVDAPIRQALERDEKVWEADVQTARLEKFKEISEAPDLPTEADKKVAWEHYSKVLKNAQILKIDLKDLPNNPDKDNIQQLTAIADSILARSKSYTSGQREPGDE